VDDALDAAATVPAAQYRLAREGAAQRASEIARLQQRNSELVRRIYELTGGDPRHAAAAAPDPAAPAPELMTFRPAASQTAPSTPMQTARVPEPVPGHKSAQLAPRLGSPVPPFAAEGRRSDPGRAELPASGRQQSAAPPTPEEGRRPRVGHAVSTAAVASRSPLIFPRLPSVEGALWAAAGEPPPMAQEQQAAAPTADRSPVFQTPAGAAARWGQGSNYDSLMAVMARYDKLHDHTDVA
jgi:hypothetical protein